MAKAGAGSGLLERDFELGRLSRALASAAAGRARVVVVEGDAGLGKSAVLERAVQLAHERGFTVARARAGVLEHTLGWGVARQLFETVLVRAPAATRRALLSGSAALAAGALGLEAVAPTGAPGMVADFHVEHGLYWLASNLSERGPVAFVVDDAQWCDIATLGWLLYLARRIESLPIVVVLARRSGEPDSPDVLLDAIAAEPAAETLRLAPLGTGATAALLEAGYGTGVDAQFALACHEWTGGNPLFVRALADELAAEGVVPDAASAPQVRRLRPAEVSRVILLRLARLPAAALDVARAVAVLESAVQLRHVAALAGLDAAVAMTAVDELSAAGVLESGYPLRFTHPLVGAVVYADLPPARRAAAHRRAAELLAEAEADGGRVAAQLLRSEPAGDPWVVAELRAAARREIASGAPAAAVPLLRRALDEPPARDDLADVLLSLGVAQSTVGDGASLATLERALDTADTVVLRGEIALALGRQLLSAGDPAAAVATLQPIADELGWEDADLRLQVEAILINAARADAGLVGVIPERLKEIAGRAGDDSYGARLISAQLSWGLTAITAPVARAVEAARGALGGGRLIAESPAVPEAYLGAIHMLTLCDELDEADALLATALEAAQRNGAAAAFAGASCVRAYAALLLGRVGDAELLARDTLRVADGMPALAVMHGLARAYLALALVERGALDDALELAGGSPAELERARGTWSTELMYAAGRARLARGDSAEAAELLLGCGRRCATWGCLNPAWLPWRSDAALALSRLGEREQARRIAADELELARRFGAARPIGIALRGHALLLDGDAQIEVLRESLGALERSPARLERARTLVALGAALRRANRRAEAREPLAAGCSLAQVCGATALADDAMTELTAAGARSRSVLRDGVDALTIAERRVCDLAAAGRSNPEIAQSLFVTRATVESHLHSAYMKLGIGSRRQLAGALQDP